MCSDASLACVIKGISSAHESKKKPWKAKILQRKRVSIAKHNRHGVHFVRRDTMMLEEEMVFYVCF